MPVASAAGFEVGQKIGIDIGGNYESATVTAVGKAATQTTLAAAATAGATNIKVAADSNMTAGDTLTVGTGGRKEPSRQKRRHQAADAAPGTPGGGGRGGAVAVTIELTAPLQIDHLAGVDVSDAGTGISFSPATKFPHTSGDAVQALGSGITLDSPLANAPRVRRARSQPRRPRRRDTRDRRRPTVVRRRPLRQGRLDRTPGCQRQLVVDAIVYGSQQSNSSGNGTIASPELATLEGDQGKGGCIVAVACRRAGGRGGAPAAGTPARSACPHLRRRRHRQPLHRFPNAIPHPRRPQPAASVTTPTEPHSSIS